LETGGHHLHGGATVARRGPHVISDTKQVNHLIILISSRVI